MPGFYAGVAVGALAAVPLPRRWLAAVATITKGFVVDCYDQLLQTIHWINFEAIYEAMTKLL